MNFMKLNPNGPNYEKLKMIEEEMKNYEIKNDGTIVNINQDNDSENKGIFYTSVNKLMVSLFILSIFL